MNKKVILDCEDMYYNCLVMHNPRKNGTTAVIILLSLCISIVFIYLISGMGNPLLKAGGIALVLILHSGLLIRISRGLTVSSRKQDRVEPERENGNLGVLIPVEDESDLGELLEVEESAPAFQAAEKEEKDTEPAQQRVIAGNDASEKLEELESCEDPVEELEAVED